MNSHIQFLKNFLYLKVSSLQNPKNVPPHSSNSCENETPLAFDQEVPSKGSRFVQSAFPQV